MNEFDLGAAEKRWGEAMKESRSDACPDAHDLIEYVEMGERAQSFAAITRHLGVCAVCRSTVRDMRDAEGLRKESSSRGWLGFLCSWKSLAIAVPVAAAVLAVMLWPLPKGGQRQLVAKQDRHSGANSEPQVQEPPKVEPLPNHAAKPPATVTGDPKISKKRPVSKRDISKPAKAGRRPNRDASPPPKQGSSTQMSPPPSNPTLAPRAQPTETWVASNLVVRDGKTFYNGEEIPGDLVPVAAMIANPPEVETQRGVDMGPVHSFKVIEPRPGNTAIRHDAAFTWEPARSSNFTRELLVEFRLTSDVDSSINIHLGKFEVRKVATLTGRSFDASFVAGEGLPTLRAGGVYRVKGTGANGSAARDLEWVYRVMTREQESQADWAKDHEASLPVMAALTYYNLGLYADALRVVEERLQDETKIREGSIEASDLWAGWLSAIRKCYKDRISKPDQLRNPILK